MKMRASFQNFSAFVLTTSFLWATFVPSVAFGAAEVPAVKKSEAAFGKSELNRQDKNYLVTGEVGFGIALIPSTGITAGMFLDSKSLIQADFTSGGFQFLDFQVRTQTAGLHYKRFIGNSFYFRGGAAYRKVEMEYDGSFFFASARKEAGFSEFIVADLAIGNQWQWRSFTMGCDWIGTMIPVARLKNDFSTDGYSDSSKKDAEDNWDRFGSGTSIQLLRFYLGASF